MKRIFVYGDQYNDVFEKNKKEWKGRYYKNLHKKGSGWSFPYNNQSIIHFLENVSSQTFNENNIIYEEKKDEIIIENKSSEIDTIKQTDFRNEIKLKDECSQTDFINEIKRKDEYTQTYFRNEIKLKDEYTQTDFRNEIKQKEKIIYKYDVPKEMKFFLKEFMN
jgi:hypothetical protein